MEIQDVYNYQTGDTLLSKLTLLNIVPVNGPSNVLTCTVECTSAFLQVTNGMALRSEMLIRITAH